MSFFFFFSPQLLKITSFDFINWWTTHVKIATENDPEKFYKHKLNYNITFKKLLNYKRFYKNCRSVPQRIKYIY